MKRLLLKIQPLTAFGSKINGGMLFGQFCCTIKMLCGEKRLQSLLDGYCDNKPFAIFSDALPQGLVPMPTLPFTTWVPAESSAAERKRWKKCGGLRAPHLTIRRTGGTNLFSRIPRRTAREPLLPTTLSDATP